MRKFTKEEQEYVIHICNKSKSITQASKILKIDRLTLKKYAKKFGCFKNGRKNYISVLENRILERKCPRCNKKLTYTDKSGYQSAVKKKDVYRKCGVFLSKKIGKSDLSILLEETPLTYYWIGFLLADGNFGKTNTVKCTLSSIDKDHLIKLKNFLKIKSVNFEKNEKYCTIKAMDGINAPLICKKFKIHNRKTYNPPKLSFIKDKDLKTALIAGFIDGDGCIQYKGKRFTLSVKCHSSWLNILSDFAKFINPTTNAKINNSGYAIFQVLNVPSLKKLKQDVIRLQLPVLKRKWDKINLNYVMHEEAHERNFKTFIKLFNKFKNFDHFKERFNKIVYGK